MPNPEGEQPDMHANHLEPTALPARVEDDTHRVLVSKNDSGVLFVRVSKGEQPIFSAAVDETDSVQVLFHSQQQAQPIPLPETEPSQEQATPLASQDTLAQPEQKNKPVRLVGTVKTVGTLEKTPKKERPVYRFQMEDEQNKTTRRIVAFDAIAVRLANEADLSAGAPIRMLAWKHTNTIHIQGQERQIEEWYPQKIWYAGTVIEKPKPKREKKLE
jgi:hypothetical protein